MTEADVYLQLAPKDLNYLVRILEGYEHLGVVTTVSRADGIVKVRATADTAPLVREIAASLPITLKLLPDYAEKS